MRFLRELPVVLFLLGAALGLLLFAISYSLAPRRRSALLRSIAFGSGILTLLVYVSLNIVSLRGYMMFSDEASIISIAAASLRGQPMYHPVTSPDLAYCLMYGPFTFLVYELPLVLGDGRFWVLKATVVLANILTCFTLFSIVRKFVERNTAVAVISFPLCALLLNVACSFGIRSDAWIVLAVSLAVRSALFESEFVAAMLTGVTAGIAIDLKVTAAPALFLILLMLYRRLGIKAASIAVGIATLTALAPFAFPGISSRNYVEWLLETRNHGIDHELLIHALFYVAFLVTPLALLAIFGVHPWKKTALTGSTTEKLLLSACLLISAIVAAMPGAGPWHFWQLLPILTAYLAIAIGGSQISGTRLEFAILLIAMGGAAVTIVSLRRDYSILRAPSPAVARILQTGRKELDLYGLLYPGRTIQMGYGGVADEWAESIRYLLPLRGQYYSLDVDAWSVEIQDGLRFPVGVIDRMNRCTNDVWLIPHKAQPFVDRQFVQFPKSLRDSFLSHYEVARTEEIFDVWTCKTSR